MVESLALSDTSPKRPATAGWRATVDNGSRNHDGSRAFHGCVTHTPNGRFIMGRGILLWLLGVPIPVIILLALIWH